MKYLTLSVKNASYFEAMAKISIEYFSQPFCDSKEQESRIIKCFGKLRFLDRNDVRYI